MPTEQPASPAAAITAELAAAYSRAGNRGAPPWWIRQTRAWPSRVVPQSNAQARCAVLTLLSTTHWHQDNLTTLLGAFTPLYEAGWCNGAIVHALDFNPDGTRVLPWLGDGKSAPAGALAQYLQRRLRAWQDADERGGIPAPPLPGVDFHSWFTRMQEHYGDGHADPRPRRDQATASAAYWQNHSTRPPVDRLRRRVDRTRVVDAELAQLGAPVPSPPVDPRDDVALLAIPEVAAALRAVVGQERPARHRLHALQEAMRHARIANRHETERVLSRVTAADVGVLASRVTGPDGKPVPPDRLRRILAAVW